MALPKSDALPVIEKWLSQHSGGIAKFYIYTEWTMWARIELYLALDAALGKTSEVRLGAMLADQKSAEEEADILIEPKDDKKPTTVIKLRCERGSENAGSFEEWADQVDKDVARIKKLKEDQLEYPGAKVLFVGLSGIPTDEEENPFQTTPPPKLLFKSGEVHAWGLEYNLPG